MTSSTTNHVTYKKEFDIFQKGPEFVELAGQCPQKAVLRKPTQIGPRQGSDEDFRLKIFEKILVY